MSDHRTQPTFGSIIAQLASRVATLELQSAGLPVYTLATRPAATAVQVGTAIFVSDAVDGQRFQGSDGTNWKTLG
jgi:hypothetical protein